MITENLDFAKMPDRYVPPFRELLTTDPRIGFLIDRYVSEAMHEILGRKYGEEEPELTDKLAEKYSLELADWLDV